MFHNPVIKEGNIKSELNLTVNDILLKRFQNALCTSFLLTFLMCGKN